MLNDCGFQASLRVELKNCYAHATLLAREINEKDDVIQALHEEITGLNIEGKKVRFSRPCLRLRI